MKVCVIIAMGLVLFGASPSTAASSKQRIEEIEDASAQLLGTGLTTSNEAFGVQLGPRNQNGDKAPSCKENSDCPTGYHCKKEAGIKSCIPKKKASQSGDPPYNGAQQSGVDVQ